MKKYRISGEVLTVAIIMGSVLAGTFTLIPDKIKIPPNYYGIAKIEFGDYIAPEEFGKLAIYRHNFIVNGLYPATNKKIQAYNQRLIKYGKEVYFFKYFTWQLGYLEGFKPIGVKNYSQPSSTLDFVFLFFSVGFISVCEAVFRGIYQFYFILLAAQGIYYVISKETIWQQD